MTRFLNGQDIGKKITCGHLEEWIWTSVLGSVARVNNEMRLYENW